MITPHKLFYKVRAVYEYFGFTSTKLQKGYYGSARYKRLINYLYDVIKSPQAVAAFKNVIPIIERLTTADFELLCLLHKEGRLNEFIALIKVAGSE